MPPGEVAFTRGENQAEIEEDGSFTDQEGRGNDGCIYSYLKFFSIGGGGGEKLVA